MKEKNKLYKMCLCMIVKNESHVILESLENMLKYIDYWVICDTGSKDGTQDIIKNFFKQKGIPGHLAQHEWKNFGWNRTKAFEEAYKKSKYVFVMDADDLIVGDFKLPKKLNMDAYYLKFGVGYTYKRLQIFNNQLKWCYRGVLHEYPECVTKPTGKLSLGNIKGNYFVNSRRLGDRNKDPLKYQKDAQLLINAIEKNEEPELRTRYLFYTAQSFRDCQQYENSIEYYQKRIDAGGWDEEIFYSWWQIGTMKQALKKDTIEIVEAYKKAYEIKPNRAETIYEIAKMYYELEDYKMAKGYFQLMYRIDKPDDGLFISDHLYSFLKYFVYAKTLNLLEEFEESNKIIEPVFKSPEVSDQDKRISMLLYNLNLQKKKLQNVPQFDDYVFYPNMDCYGNDIEYAKTTDIMKLKELSDQNPQCKAFNTYGFLKDKICDKSKMIALQNMFNVTDGIYIKKSFVQEIEQVKQSNDDTQ